MDKWCLHTLAVRDLDIDPCKLMPAIKWKLDDLHWSVLDECNFDLVHWDGKNLQLEGRWPTQLAYVPANADIGASKCAIEGTSEDEPAESWREYSLRWKLTNKELEIALRKAKWIFTFGVSEDGDGQPAASNTGQFAAYIVRLVFEDRPPAYGEELAGLLSRTALSTGVPGDEGKIDNTRGDLEHDEAGEASRDAENQEVVRDPDYPPSVAKPWIIPGDAFRKIVHLPGETAEQSEERLRKGHEVFERFANTKLQSIFLWHEDFIRAFRIGMVLWRGLELSYSKNKQRVDSWFDKHPQASAGISESVTATGERKFSESSQQVAAGMASSSYVEKGGVQQQQQKGSMKRLQEAMSMEHSGRQLQPQGKQKVAVGEPTQDEEQAPSEQHAQAGHQSQGEQQAPKQCLTEGDFPAMPPGDSDVLKDAREHEAPMTWDTREEAAKHLPQTPLGQRMLHRWHKDRFEDVYARLTRATDASGKPTPDAKIPLCHWFALGNCRAGRYGCDWSHDVEWALFWRVWIAMKMMNENIAPGTRDISRIGPVRPPCWSWMMEDGCERGGLGVDCRNGWHSGWYVLDLTEKIWMKKIKGNDRLRVQYLEEAQCLYLEASPSWGDATALDQYYPRAK